MSLRDGIYAAKKNLEVRVKETQRIVPWNELTKMPASDFLEKCEMYLLAHPVVSLSRMFRRDPPYENVQIPLDWDYRSVAISGTPFREPYLNRKAAEVVSDLFFNYIWIAP